MKPPSAPESPASFYCSLAVGLKVQLSKGESGSELTSLLEESWKTATSWVFGTWYSFDGGAIEKHTMIGPKPEYDIGILPGSSRDRLQHPYCMPSCRLRLHMASCHQIPIPSDQHRWDCLPFHGESRRTLGLPKPDNHGTDAPRPNSSRDRVGHKIRRWVESTDLVTTFSQFWSNRIGPPGQIGS